MTSELQVYMADDVLRDRYGDDSRWQRGDMLTATEALIASMNAMGSSMEQAALAFTSMGSVLGGALGEVTSKLTEDDVLDMIRNEIHMS